MQNNKRVVLKVGTKVLTSKDRALDSQRVKDIAFQIADAWDNGTKVILVTSGAIGAGLWLLNLKKRPGKLSELQAAAAIGQSYLMDLYSEFLKKRGYLAGQMLLTQEDFSDRKRYLNIKNTIDALLGHNVVPIINENDTVATDEIRCGDNDRLSSLVADLCRADKLIILTDVDGLLDKDGKTISYVSEITSKIAKLGAGSHCDLGTGGMVTKIIAAKTAAGAGVECVIANGHRERVLEEVLKGSSIGTTFKRGAGKFIAKKRWIAFSSRSKGAISVDDGAKTALGKDKSLLASGITGVEGHFKSGDVVKITDKDGKEFARGLSNYSSEDISKVKGMRSDKFKVLLGHSGSDEIIHKDNLVIL